MEPLFDRLAAADPGRLVAGASALVALLIDAAFIAAAATGRWDKGGVAAAAGVTVIAAIGLLYAFGLGNRPAST